MCERKWTASTFNSHTNTLNNHRHHSQSQSQSHHQHQQSGTGTWLGPAPRGYAHLQQQQQQQPPRGRIDEALRQLGSAMVVATNADSAANNANISGSGNANANDNNSPVLAPVIVSPLAKEVNVYYLLQRHLQPEAEVGGSERFWRLMRTSAVLSSAGKWRPRVNVRERGVWGGARAGGSRGREKRRSLDAACRTT